MTTETDDGYKNTISGLVRRRAEMFGEAERLRDRIAEIRNDVQAIDRTLGALGYKGDLDAHMPRQKREVIFGQGELTGALMRELRDADGPMTSRELLNNVLALRGDDVRERRLLTEVTKRVSKAPRHQREEGRVRFSTDRLGNMFWSRRGGRSEVVGKTDLE